MIIAIFSFPHFFFYFHAFFSFCGETNPASLRFFFFRFTQEHGHVQIYFSTVCCSDAPQETLFPRVSLLRRFYTPGEIKRKGINLLRFINRGLNANILVRGLKLLLSLCERLQLMIFHFIYELAVLQSIRSDLVIHCHNY